MLHRCHYCETPREEGEECCVWVKLDKSNAENVRLAEELGRLTTRHAALTRALAVFRESTRQLTQENDLLRSKLP